VLALKLNSRAVKRLISLIALIVQLIFFNRALNAV